MKGPPLLFLRGQVMEYDSLHSAHLFGCLKLSGYEADGNVPRSWQENGLRGWSET